MSILIPTLKELSQIYTNKKKYEYIGYDQSAQTHVLLNRDTNKFLSVGSCELQLMLDQIRDEFVIK